MNDGRGVEEIITTFLLSTCRLRPQLSQTAVMAARRCAQVATLPTDDPSEVIPLTTGSAAEFYIEPMLPHIGDIDVMFHQSTQLAIPQGHPPPTQLPAEFQNYIQVYEIIGSHLPGYVYLVLRYLLTECVNESKYNAVEYHEQHLYLLNRCYSKTGGRPIHGPALFIVYEESLPLCDLVHCVRCLLWPPQAADWPTRHRNYGWPDSATVDRVVSNGCDVVGAVHRQCRQHEWMRENQWRMSFSRAEIVLINSWMPVQQIVYHMLRVFMKNERLTDTADNSGAGTLSNYHIKTLMLWECEVKSHYWWTDDLNLVRICVGLLHILGDWLTDARCQHYFINNCNLIDNSLNLTDIGGRLMSIDTTWLSKWFVDDYIRKCFQLCSHSRLCSYCVSRLRDDVSTTMKLQNAVSSIVVWRQRNTTLDLFRELVRPVIEFLIPADVYTFLLTPRSCACWMTELAKINSSCLSVYFTAIAFIHVAHELRHDLNDELIDILATVFGQFIYRQHYSNSLLSLHLAVNLIKVVANKSLSTMSLIAIELSKTYLYRALSCEDSFRGSIYCLANVYLAVLYYATGQYQMAIDHCTMVMRSQDHSQCSSHVVQGELLPEIDDVDNVLGLVVFYQHVRRSAFNHQYLAQHVNVLTTELFAHYLHIKCQSIIAQGLPGFREYEIRLSDTEQLFVGDVLLFLSLSWRLKQKFYNKPIWHQFRQPTVNPSENNASDLVELLQKSAVEHLTTYRQIVARDFGSVVTIVATDFEALYAYKRGDYEQCLQLCTGIPTLLHAKHCAAGVPTFPQFIQLLDDDIVSLTALTLIVDPHCRSYHSGYICISQLTLLLYLMTQCQLKLRHSVASLAQTHDYIQVAQRRHEVEWMLDLLVLKMISHKTLTYITTMMNN